MSRAGVVAPPRTGSPLSQHTRSGAPSPVSNRQHTAPLAAASPVNASRTLPDRPNNRLILDVAAQHSTDA